MPSVTWMERAACKQLIDMGEAEFDDWFPAPGDREAVERAKTICNTRCPVVMECLEWALEIEGREAMRRHGILGGHTPAQRAILVRLRNTPRKTHCPRGHPYNDANTYTDSRGWRQCRTCKDARNVARRVASSGG